MGSCQQGLLSSNAALGGLTLFQSWNPTVTAGGSPNNFFNIQTKGEMGGGSQTIANILLVPDWYPLLRGVAAIAGYEARVSLISGPPGSVAVTGAALGTFFAPSSNGGINIYNVFNSVPHTSVNVTFQVDFRRAGGGVILASAQIQMATIFP